MTRPQKIIVSDANATNQVVDRRADRHGHRQRVWRASLPTRLLIQEGSASAAHRPVFGDQLLSYLSQLVAIFNAHVHPGQMAAGISPP